MNILEINDLHKIYDENTVPVHAIKGINLIVEKGEFTAIVGPSGSGKTTLLNLIGGLDKPSRGEITIEKIKINDLSARQLTEFRLKNIGFVFQSYNLIPVLTARENVEFIMQLQGWSKSKRQQRTVSLLEEVGLAERIDSRPAKMSGGQQQRVAVARAIASKPKFVLADEPTANLDSKTAEKLLEIMEKLNQQENITFIFSTHDPRVMKKARRVITIVDGKINGDDSKEK